MNVAVIGDKNVGKTTLIQLFLSPHERVQPTPTLMLDTYSFMFRVGFQKKIRIHITEISLDKCLMLAGPHLRNIDLAVVVYDVTRPDRYFMVKEWFKLLEAHPPRACIVVCSKNDCIVPSIPGPSVENYIETYKRLGWSLSHIRVNPYKYSLFTSQFINTVSKIYTRNVPKKEVPVAWRPVVLTATEPKWECSIL